MINKYNKSIDSIRSQELAIEKVKNQLEQLQSYKDWGVLKDSEAGKMQELNNKLELMKSKLSQSKDEANQTKKSIIKLTKQKLSVPGLNDVQKGIKDINKQINKFGKRITGLLLSTFVFNVVSKGLTSIKNSMISLLKSNDEFNSNLNQIKANLMTAFAPIYNACLPAINSLMHSLAVVTGTIAQFTASLFGMDLSQASKQAKDLSKSLNKVSSSGDEASGSLGKFDKLDVISTSSNSGNANNTIDYSGEIQVSSKLLEILNNIKDFVTENKDEVIAFLLGVAGAILAIKLGCSGIVSLGIGLLVAGLVIAIKSLIDFLNDPTFENFIDIIVGIGIAVIGLGLIIGSFPLVIAGAIALIVALLVKNYDKIVGIIDNLTNWLDTNFREKLVELFGPLGNFIADVFVTGAKMAKTAFEQLYGGIKKIINGIVQIFKGDFKNGIKNVFEGLKSIALGPINTIIEGLNQLIKGINKIKFNVPDWVPGIGGKSLGFNIPSIPKLAEGAVIPPRQEFMAILGDQKRGINIETPLDTMIDAFNKALEKRDDKTKEIILKNLQFVIQLGMKDFKKIVIEALRLTEKETGKQLLVS